MLVVEKFAALQKDRSAIVALMLSPLSIAMESGAQVTWHGLLKETIWVGKPYRQAESVYRILSRECERGAQCGNSHTWTYIEPTLRL
jgi:hypothetical protein